MTVTTVVKVIGASSVVDVVEGERYTVVSRVEVLETVAVVSRVEVLGTVVF